MRKLMTAPVLALLVVAGCGGGGGSSSNSSSTSAASSLKQQIKSSIKVAADPTGGLAYIPKSLQANAGSNTFVFANTTATDHNFAIENPKGGGVLAATPIFTQGVKSVSVNLQPGTYTFFCQVPGHRQAGMVGTITVK
jgi:uncharacterized cupredoxin-like copper-binding protein